MTTSSICSLPWCANGARASSCITKAGAKDLVRQEEEEAKIISGFLPKQLDEDEIRIVTREVITEVGASGIRDMGRIMGQLKERYAGRMDFGKASGIVKELLTAN